MLLGIVGGWAVLTIVKVVDGSAGNGYVLRVADVLMLHGTVDARGQVDDGDGCIAIAVVGVGHIQIAVGHGDALGI